MRARVISDIAEAARVPSASETPKCSRAFRRPAFADRFGDSVRFGTVLVPGAVGQSAPCDGTEGTETPSLPNVRRQDFKCDSWYETVDREGPGTVDREGPGGKRPSRLGRTDFLHEQAGQEIHRGGAADRLGRNKNAGTG